MVSFGINSQVIEILDVQFEINSVKTQKLGDIVLLWQNGDDLDDFEQRKLIGLAVCQLEPRLVVEYVLSSLAQYCHLQKDRNRRNKVYESPFQISGSLHQPEYLRFTTILTSRPLKKEEKVSARACFSIQFFVVRLFMPSRYSIVL
jgi:hypothetical protein